MPTNLVFVLILTGFVHLLTTMSYAMWIVGARTQKIAVSFSLFNLIVILTRTSNTFQAPLLAKHVETSLISPGGASDEWIFRVILLVASAATVAGAFLIPTFQRLMVKTVHSFSEYRSVPRILGRGLSRSGFLHLRQSFTFPSISNLSQLRLADGVPIRILLLNSIAVSVLTVGFLSSLFAAYLNPGLRATSINLAAVVTGIATVLLFVFVDPHLSVMTDDYVAGDIQAGLFRQRVVLLAGSRVVGTILAQLLLLPASWIIVKIAEVI